MKWKNIDWITISICSFVIVFSISMCVLMIYRLRTVYEIKTDKPNWNMSETIIEKIESDKQIIDSIVNPCYIEEPEPVYPLSDYDRWYVECMVAGEAKGEPLLGKMAVAQCILNAMIQDGYSPDEVRKEYQYSGWDEDLKSNHPEAYEEVAYAVWSVFDNGEVVTQENILWFYAPRYSKSKFHNTQNFVIEIGNHRFYSPKENEV